MLQADQENASTTGAVNDLSQATFRLIVDQPRDGRENMAIDEALMESAGKPGALPVFRFYSFNPPTLSVGRFQETENVFDFEAIRRDGITFVRRPSGGQAVLHDTELTYSAVAGRELVSHLSKRGFYRFIVPVLLEGLKRLEVSGTAAESGVGSGNPDCFAATGEYEIQSSTGKKLIGSAQMVSRSAVLQHGSIPLGRANRRIHAYILDDRGENTSSSILEETGAPVDVVKAANAFSEALKDILKIKLSRLSDGEKKRAKELLAERYENPQWNRKY